MPNLRKAIFNSLMAAVITLPLSSCAAFHDNPVGTTAVVAALPVLIPVAVAIGVPLEMLRIADEQDRLARISPRPANERPMFGGIAKTPAMLLADQQFIADSAKYGDRAHTSDLSVALGWKYFTLQKDIAAAMKRFNQAWLLDPDNGDAFHGFAVLVMTRDHDAVQADALFQLGMVKPRQSPGIYLDYGRFLMGQKRAADAIAPLRKALTFADMGPDAEALLTLALYQSGDTPAACAERIKVQGDAQKSLGDAVRAMADACKTASP